MLSFLSFSGKPMVRASDYWRLGLECMGPSHRARHVTGKHGKVFLQLAAADAAGRYRGVKQAPIEERR